MPDEALVRRDIPPDSPGTLHPVSPPDKLIKALEAHVATLKEQLAAAEARIDKQADDLAEYDRAYAADLAAERAQTAKAIAAFASLADRLDAMAAERAKPWWRRLAG